MSQLHDYKFLLFLGDAPDQLAAKTAIALAQWQPERCIGQLSLQGCVASSPFPEMTLIEAFNAGATALLIGTTSRGGKLPDNWINIIRQALAVGLDIVNSMHTQISEINEIKLDAQNRGRRVIELRRRLDAFPIGTGEKREGHKLLTVGTDCSVGKMYTSLSLRNEFRRQGRSATLKATGQTGILIAGSGVCLDSVVSDFLVGAVESLTPDTTKEEWSVIEGQASIAHPSYAPISLALLLGTRPDAIVVCHEPTRKHLRGLPAWPVQEVSECIESNLAIACKLNVNACCVGISINTSQLDAFDARRYLENLQQQVEVPCVDPSRTGVKNIIDYTIEKFG